MIRRVAVRAIIVHNGKLLCACAKPYNPNIVTGRWGVPGGGVDSNEALIPALEREITEELGVVPNVGNLLYIQQFKQKNGTEALEFLFYIKNGSDYLNIDLSKTSHGHVEIEKIDFINPAEHTVVPKFLTTESLENLANQQTKIFNYF
jgi:ADP-ribose pyrophosphatase YjhB (NUDIX family)